MSMRTQSWSTRWRSAAVALVMVLGGGATLATSSAPRCPDFPEGAASEFFRPPSSLEGWSRDATPSTFRAVGFDVERTTVHFSTCVRAETEKVPVMVRLEMAGESTGAVPQAWLSAMTVTDGHGRTWSPVSVFTRGAGPAYADSGYTLPARSEASFMLPVDVEAPVRLHLGELGGVSRPELSLDAQGPREQRP
ncbi:hypothetical protein [Cellulomonas alba]|uniref:DUF4352 domain-containing protein n=1 Tax=Cellulomonas alba TaxID=3053467 RepID=A0ABT7SEA9_9CELL|nr:hypothetical protein [Cellulomonas alba]MDM7854528.1 hypothetical protein [Cellulomonas alba]